PWQRRGEGVVRSTSERICEDVGRTIPNPSFAKEGNARSPPRRSTQASALPVECLRFRLQIWREPQHQPADASRFYSAGLCQESCRFSSFARGGSASERSHPRNSDRHSRECHRHKLRRTCIHTCRYALRQSPAGAPCCNVRKSVGVPTCRLFTTVLW